MKKDEVKIKKAAILALNDLLITGGEGKKMACLAEDIESFAGFVFQTEKGSIFVSADQIKRNVKGPERNPQYHYW
jgi:hypothetical protein